MNKIILTLLFSLLFCLHSSAQSEINSDSITIERIYTTELTKGSAYNNLRSLCKDVGHRLSGSESAEKAVKWAEEVLKSIPADTVYLQPVMVPHWVRGEKEYAELRFNGFIKPLEIIALGGSVGTPKEGVTAEVIEVQGLEELKDLGEEKIKGKIVFYNRPMNPEHIMTFHAYGGCVDQRYSGASVASKYGAVAMVVRSMNLRLDNLPHTGAQKYQDGIQPIPATAISTIAAELLSKVISENPEAKLTIKLNCENLPDVESYNVIAEIKGSEFPEEIIAVGGHLDSWDVGDGAHDDGAGVVHSMEVINLFKTLEITPKRTIRCVLFMNEENGLKGAVKYAEVAKEKRERHIAAIESDAGGFTPRGFGVAGQENIKSKCLIALNGWKPYFEPYLVHYFEEGHGGADINQLKDQNCALIGFIPDSQRYFEHHHAELDVFENVNKRELELGAATITSLVYLLTEHGL